MKKINCSERDNREQPTIIRLIFLQVGNGSKKEKLNRREVRKKYTVHI